MSVTFHIFDHLIDTMLQTSSSSYSRLDIINSLLQDPVEESSRRKGRDGLSLGIATKAKAPHWLNIKESVTTREMKTARSTGAIQGKKMKKASSERTFKGTSSRTAPAHTEVTEQSLANLCPGQDEPCPFTLTEKKDLRKQLKKAHSEPTMKGMFHVEEYSFHLFLDQEEDSFPSVLEETFQISDWINPLVDKEVSVRPCMRKAKKIPQVDKKKCSVGSNVLQMARDKARASIKASIAAAKMAHGATCNKALTKDFGSRSSLTANCA
jgi:hypothetical protein